MGRLLPQHGAKKSRAGGKGLKIAGQGIARLLARDANRRFAEDARKIKFLTGKRFPIYEKHGDAAIPSTPPG